MAIYPEAVQNIYSRGSDKLSEVQLNMSASCQPGSRVIRAFLTLMTLKSLFCLRNGFLVTVIVAQYTTGWRSVESLTTDRLPVIYWETKHLLARFCFDSNTQETTKGKCILQMFPVFSHYMKRNSAKNFDCNGGIYMYFVGFSREKTTLYSLTLWT